jgi:Beta-lactamase class C and other penicillin binding proteins
MKLISFKAQILVLSLIFFGVNQLIAQQSKQQLANNINNYIEQVKDTWQLPGLAAAFYIDGEVILSKGYGIKEQVPADGIGYKGSRVDDRKIASGGFKGVVNRANSPIDNNTVFQIGSVSKSFTATVMASLVDEKKIKWEDTVKNILPDFKMYDSWVTENMQVKDIMTHHTGLAEQAGTYFPNLGYNRDDIYKMLALMKPAYSFRGDYQYNNITFIIASKIIEKITGKSWEENVYERIFNPLKMNSSSLNAKGYATSENVATPHDYSYLGKIVTLPLYADEQALYWLTGVGPAGSVNSSVNDMIKYAQMHMNNGFIVNKNNQTGNLDTIRIISEEAAKYLHKGQTITSQNDNKINLYGHCWFVEQNNRYKLYFHTGTTWGMTALCFYVPQYKLCGVILVNSEAGSSPRYAIMRRYIDLAIGAPADTYTDVYKDYNKEYFQEWLTNSKKRWEKSQTEEANKVIKPAPDSNKLVGDYVKDELFGDAKISIENGDLYIEIGKNGFKIK